MAPSSSSYAESASRGDVASTLRYAVLHGALWAIGSAWATAIRSVVLALVPDETREVVLGELLAVGLTTALGVGVSLVAAKPRPSREPPRPTPTRGRLPSA